MLALKGVFDFLENLSENSFLAEKYFFAYLVLRKVIFFRFYRKVIFLFFKFLIRKTKILRNYVLYIYKKKKTIFLKKKSFLSFPGKQTSPLSIFVSPKVKRIEIVFNRSGHFYCLVHYKLNLLATPLFKMP